MSDVIEVVGDAPGRARTARRIRRTSTDPGLTEWEIEAGPNPVEPLTMNINVSGAQLAHAGFVDFMATTTEARGIRPEQINIEGTEILLMDAAGVIPIMQRLADMGIKLSIDDFGTGYSSLSDLHGLPFDTLKIDRSFVDRIGDGDKGQEIVRSIVALGRPLGKSLVAEGIENEAPLLMLRELHCDEGQGYYFSRPLSSEAITPMLAVWRDAMLDQQRTISCKTRSRSTRMPRAADPAGERRPPRSQQRRQVPTVRA